LKSTRSTCFLDVEMHRWRCKFHGGNYVTAFFTFT
jgi:hypothetical protein